ncbi:Hypothetical protein R9X50_00437300 [Acrodontium crateriforme]|uniref:Uncharacterized protein n=1 Tax=Acrodontium crateriforme TaxID=150365 RepID=A0AAQ3M481_9PEZI|nr:Hypothetical protein R9X50_00437300 [Acrodontium crateriforme]
MSNCFINEFGNEACTDGDWIIWGRWVVVAAVIVVVLGIYLVFSCVSARRRHKAGAKPYIGTQWALGPNPPQYNSTETLPSYPHNTNNRSQLGDHDVEAQRIPDVAHEPADRKH